MTRPPPGSSRAHGATTRPRPVDPRRADGPWAGGGIDDDADWANRFVWLDQPGTSPGGADQDRQNRHYRPPGNRPPGNRPPRRPVGNRLADFARHYGWRAYALPVLVVITIAALVSTTGQKPKQPAATKRPVASGSSSATPPEASPSNTVKVDPGNNAEALPGDALPPGAKYTTQGDGTFRILKGTSPKVGSGKLVTFAIEVENGVSSVDLAKFQSAIVSTLSDSRSWTAGGQVALQRVDTADADVRVALTSSMTVRQICGYDQKIETSCFQKWYGLNQVTLNVARWVRGDVQFGQDLTTYHQYMVNHEFGHSLGHVHSYTCLPNGLAPVMMQETITLKENQGSGPKICEPNSWPYPPGVAKSAAVTT